MMTLSGVDDDEDDDGCTSIVKGRGCDTMIDDGLTPAAVATAF